MNGYRLQEDAEDYQIWVCYCGCGHRIRIAKSRANWPDFS